MTATLTRPEPDTTLDYPDTLLIGDHPDIDHLDDGDVPEAFYTTNAPGNHCLLYTSDAADDCCRV